MRILDKLQRWLLKPFFGNHEHAKLLETISDLLDANPEIASLAHDDLIRGTRADTGRTGMTGDQVVRVLLLKQLHDATYRELEFNLQDSTAYRAFAMAPQRKPWSWTTLQGNIKLLQPGTLQAINQILVRAAQAAGIENGSRIRADCTAIESNIHKPTDSSLLCDGIRVLTRLLRKACKAAPEAGIHFSDHTTRARRRNFAIEYPAKGKGRKRHLRRNYRCLLKVATKTCSYAQTALQQLSAPSLILHTAGEVNTVGALRFEIERHLTTMARVMDQSTRRVFKGEEVPAADKVLSIFETHTDIIVKGERDIVFGHKMCLTSGKSSLILDCFVEQGNPADATLVRPVLERHVRTYGKPPRQATFDGGFASKENLRIAKEELLVQDVAFHKKCGLKVEDMARSPWVYRQLKRFRAGIEGLISALKSGGMKRCSWRSQDSMDSFRCYVWSHVLAFNVSVIATALLSR